MSIKAIETKYKGYRFRSRLEARWAVFFDAIDVQWEYEKEGVDLGGTWYLPDFWFPRYSLWVEIKPDKPSEDEAGKAIRLQKLSNNPVILLCGSPWLGEYFGLFLRSRQGPPKDDEIDRYSQRHGLPKDEAEAQLEAFSFQYDKFNKLARCRKCGHLFWVWETEDGSEFDGGALGIDCCHIERYPLEIPESFYTKARSARFEHGETPK